MFNRLDRYIIGKFLGTFFFSIVLILSIAVVFDLTEKMDDFFEHQLTWRQIIGDYYIYFLPYYYNMFSALFVFISVIFFTSKLAGNSELIAMFAAGMSYRRLMVPYLFSALLLAGMSYGLSMYVIPTASARMLDFTDQYVAGAKLSMSDHARNIQMEVAPNTILYIESFQRESGVGYRASLDRFEGKKLVSRITAQRISCDSVGKWRMEDCVVRNFEGLREQLRRETYVDTMLQVMPNELFVTSEYAQRMTMPELLDFIHRQQERGTGNVLAFETEYHKRWASCLGALIMTLLGVTMSSRKIRGGMGKNLGVGLVLTTLYILFTTVSTTFVVNDVLSPFWAAWLPNFVFLALSVPLYFRART